MAATFGVIRYLMAVWVCRKHFVTTWTVLIYQYSDTCNRIIRLIKGATVHDIRVNSMGLKLIH